MNRFLPRFAALVIVVLIPAIASSQNFTDPLYLKTPTKGTFLVPGDFNGDAKTDLAYWTPEPDLDLYVLYNEGDRKFTKSVYSVEGVKNLKGLEVGDFNGDGNDDIVTLETTQEGSKIILLTSTGTSWTQTTIATTQNLASDLRVAKFDADDHLDFLVALELTGIVAYKGDGTGAFATETQQATAGLRTFRCVDLNNDDVMDFVGLTNGGLKTYIKGEVGYEPSERTFVEEAADIEVADFDGDEFPDVAISFFTSTSGKVEIFTNSGDPATTFPTSQSVAVGRQPFFLASADYDNDGRIDLAASSFDFPSVIIFNNTPGGFVSQGPVQTKGNGDFGVIFAQMDDDDLLEVVEIRQQEINIHKRTDFNDFALDQTIMLAFFGGSGIVTDMNNDGNNDIVAPSSKAVSVQYGHGDFTFDAPVFTPVVGDIQISISVADFNNDDFADVVYTGNGETGIMLSDNGILQEPLVIFGSSMGKLASADFDKDGNMDFAGLNYIMLGDGAGNFTQEFVDMFSVSSIDVGYFNDDALPDLAFTAFDGIAYIGLNTGASPVFAFFEVVPDVAGQPLMKAANFNNDDLTDLVVGGSFVPKFSILVNDGDGTFTRKDFTLIQGDGAFAELPSLVDLNNDNLTDIVVPYSDFPTYGGVRVFMQTAGDYYQSTINFDPLQAPGYATLGDLNNDQQVDIVGFDLNSVNAISIVPSLYQPKVAPTALSASDITSTSVKLTLQNGSGSGSTIFVRVTGDLDALPVDDTFYAASPEFGAGLGPVSSMHAVVKGPVKEVVVTNLTKGATYTATAYEYNQNTEGTGIDYLPVAVEVQFTTKKDQTISATFPDKVMGTGPFTLTGSSTSDLPLTFEAVTANIKVEGATVSLLAPGPATIKVSQAGSSIYNPAEVQVKFCVIPVVPTITVENLSPSKYKLTSSSDANNQWLFSGTAISGATAKTFEPAEDGVYSVKVSVGQCTNTSQPTNYLITGLEDISENISLYPNPASDVVTIQTGPYAISSSDVLFTDATGRQHFFNGRQEGHNRLTVNMGTTLIRGLYVIEVQTNIGAVRKKVVID